VWKRATKSAKQDGKLIHDLRRSAARDFSRAGVSEAEIMALCGWQTREMFERYNVVGEARLSEAVGKRYGTLKANSALESAPPPL